MISLLSKNLVYQIMSIHILAPIALFASVSRRGLGPRIIREAKRAMEARVEYLEPPFPHANAPSAKRNTGDENVPSLRFFIGRRLSRETRKGLVSNSSIR